LNKQKLRKYKELIARIERQEKLKEVEMELQTQKNLMVWNYNDIYLIYGYLIYRSFIDSS